MKEYIKSSQESMQKYPIYLRFWFFGLIFTLVYLSLKFNPIFTNLDITNFIGLFVPFGLWNSIYSLTSFTGFLSIPLSIFFIFSAEKFALHLGIKSFMIKIVFNLVLLIFLTCFVDLLIWQDWLSMDAFLHKPLRF